MAYTTGAHLASARRLLVLARDLLQAQDLKSILELLGPALQELLSAEEALLSIDLDDLEYATAFDPRGFLQPADQNGLLYRHSMQAMGERKSILIPETAAAQPDVGHVSLVALPFPPFRPVGVMAARWDRKSRRPELARRLAILQSMAEFTGAALANVHSRLQLEAEVSARTEEIEAAAQEHARELERRDKREEETRRISITDMLTGMLNRRGFFLHADQVFKLARRQQAASLLMFADVDGLKAVNDGLGHHVGDRLIQDSAWVMRNSFRDSDIVARFGGDEFAAFTLDTAEPAVILNRIQGNIAAFQQQTPRPYRVSFSIGIVQCDPDADLGLSDYLALADKEMYAQKRRR